MKEIRTKSLIRIVLILKKIKFKQAEQKRMNELTFKVGVAAFNSSFLSSTYPQPQTHSTTVPLCLCTRLVSLAVIRKDPYHSFTGRGVVSHDMKQIDTRFERN